MKLDVLNMRGHIREVIGISSLSAMAGFRYPIRCQQTLGYRSRSLTPGVSLEENAICVPRERRQILSMETIR